MFNLILNMKKQSDQTKLRGILKTGWDSSKNVSASKNKKEKQNKKPEVRRRKEIINIREEINKID